MKILNIIGRKMLSALISSMVLSFLFTIFGYESPQLSEFIFIYMYAAGYSILIGVPCSMISDIIIHKINGTFIRHIMGLTIHLFFAGLVTYWFFQADETLMGNYFMYAVFIAAIGLWLIDSILRRSRIFNKTSH
ncbi:hypothetical protein [Paenibacillus sp. 1P07SE]|uniref:hypothetical protein n=1 Tax=Paenibacillus sp. 1P07SE TaxID=3132209 RepID=UPI0039A58073